MAHSPMKTVEPIKTVEHNMRVREREGESCKIKKETFHDYTNKAGITIMP